jgi:hypothetical protein
LAWISDQRSPAQTSSPTSISAITATIPARRQRLWAKTAEIRTIAPQLCGNPHIF